jgi:DUF4097 and DUF4098 domain-containing protein YvlB
MFAVRIVCLAAATTLLAGCQRVGPNVVVNGVQITTDAKVMKEEVAAKSFQTGATPHVVVELFSGPISVTRGDDGTVAAEVTKRGGGETEADAAAMLKRIDLTFEQVGDRVRVSATLPPGQTFIGETAAKVKVPSSAVLELRTQFGAVAVTGVNGAIDARTSNGPVAVKDGNGPLKLVSDFGNIDANGVNTTVNARTSNGGVTVRGATGKLDLKSDFGKIDVDAPSPSVTARTSNGRIVVRSATGELALNTDFQNIDIDAPCAAVKAKTSNGAITVNKAKGPLDLHSDFGDIRVDTPGGEVTAVTSNGKITVRGATGRLHATTAFGGLDLAADKAVVTAKTSNGAIKFSGSLADGAHTFHNDFGEINVSLPADARFRLDAHTSFGEVTTGFAITPPRGKDRSQLKGTVGDNPAATVTLTTSNGRIRVQPIK